MVTENRLIYADEALRMIANSKEDNPFENVRGQGAIWRTAHNSATDCVNACPTVDAVEVVRGYHVGDVCFYGFPDGNQSLSLVEIQKILNDERGVAEIKILKVFVDDSGNGWFNYLLKSGGTMNASFKYLKNVTPIGAKMDKNENP